MIRVTIKTVNKEGAPEFPCRVDTKYIDDRKRLEDDVVFEQVVKPFMDKNPDRMLYEWQIGRAHV